MNSRSGFPKWIVLECDKICLTLLVIMKMVNKKVIIVVLNVAKYIITALLGYFGGNAVME